jgi:hypothetical protein
VRDALDVALFKQGYESEVSQRERDTERVLTRRAMGEALLEVAAGRRELRHQQHRVTEVVQGVRDALLIAQPSA